MLCSCSVPARYDIAGDTYTMLPGKLSRTMRQPNPTVEHNGLIYLYFPFSGWSWTNEVHVYDTASDSWTFTADGMGTPVCHMRHPTFYHLKFYKRGPK